jgi:hypothetical protein
LFYQQHTETAHLPVTVDIDSVAANIWTADGLLRQTASTLISRLPGFWRGTIAANPSQSLLSASLPLRERRNLEQPP